MEALLGNDPAALRLAAGFCGLDYHDGPRKFHTASLSSPIRVNGENVDIWNNLAVLSMSAERASRMSNIPHEVGVIPFQGHLLLVMDPYKMGRGMETLLGSDMNRLRRRFYLEVVLLWAKQWGITVLSQLARKDGIVNIKLRYDEMKTVTVTINKIGNATVETDGFQGVECLKTIADLVSRLGTVEKTEEKSEMHCRPQTTHVSAGVTG